MHGGSSVTWKSAPTRFMQRNSSPPVETIPNTVVPVRPEASCLFCSILVTFFFSEDKFIRYHFLPFHIRTNIFKTKNMLAT
jgi:hypothetical protein